MSINRIYKGNCFILGFTDSEMRHNYLPISVNKDKISCTCSNTRFNGAFVINHVNGKHTINIDWNRVIMTQPVENFDLYVKYDGSLRISENIRIEYPYPIYTSIFNLIKVLVYGEHNQIVNFA